MLIMEECTSRSFQKMKNRIAQLKISNTQASIAIETSACDVATSVGGEERNEFSNLCDEIMNEVQADRVQNRKTDECRSIHER
jgi:hypothetical protein